MAKWRILSTLVASFLLMLSIGIPQAVAQLITEEVVLGDGALGRYRAPEVGPVSHIAFLAIHRTSDYRNHASSTNLANRGFGTLGIRARFGNSEAAVNFELITLDVRNGIRFLKNVKGHTHVILTAIAAADPPRPIFRR